MSGPDDLLCHRCGFEPEPGSEETRCPVDGHYLVARSEHDKAPRDPFLGTVIGEEFPILGIAGHGGMGMVYRSVQRLVEREVAIKLLQPTPTRIEDVVRQRFLREAKAIARVTHPAIVTLYQFGVEDDGTAFMVMEYVHGRTLASLLAEGPVRPARIVDVCLQVLEALQAAHKHGLIHRDLKPDNIMLLREPVGPYHIKVLDFGLARLAASEEGKKRLTRTGAVFGTPQYMAPEQATGQDADERTDLYALGVVLFEALTGDIPFDADEPYSLLTKHLTTPVPDLPVSLRDDLKAVVRKALAKEREDRYQSAPEMADALRAVRDRLQAEGPVRTEPDDAESRTTVPTLKAPRGPADTGSRRPELLDFGAPVDVAVTEPATAPDLEAVPVLEADTEPEPEPEPAAAPAPVALDADVTARDVWPRGGGAGQPSTLGESSGEVGWSLESMEIAGVGRGRVWRRVLLSLAGAAALAAAGVFVLREDGTGGRAEELAAPDEPPPDPPVGPVVEPRPPPPQTTVHLDSVPLGAEVRLRGRLLGETPLTLTPSGRLGSRVVYRLVADGRRAATLEVVLDGREQRHVVRLESLRKTGRRDDRGSR